MKTNCVLDTGSNTTLISSALVKRLRLRGNQASLKLHGINSVRTLKTTIVKIALTSVDKKCHINLDEVREISDIGNKIRPLDWNEYKSHVPHFNDVDIPVPAEDGVHLLIGLDYRTLLIHRDYREDPDDLSAPLALRTSLGWSCTGEIDRIKFAKDSPTYSMLSIPKDVLNTFHTSLDEDDSNHDTVIQIGQIPVCYASAADVEIMNILEKYYKKFWDNEEFPDSSITVEDEHCLALLKSSYKIVSTPDGPRVQVSPLWRPGQPEGFVTNYGYALHRAKSVIKGMSVETYNTIDKIYNEYVAMGIAQQVSVQDPYVETALYWANFPVWRGDSETTPCRPVMDGAAKCLNGKSINEHCFLQGPNLLCDLTQVLLRFRQYSVAFTGDISKMFLRILLPPEDRKFHRFIWWDQERKNPQIYEFLGHLFGNVGSPTCSIWTCRKNAIDHSKEFPRAADVVLKSTVVDDGLDSAPTPEAASAIISDLIKLYNKIGLKINKFATNSSEVQIPDGVVKSETMFEFEKFYVNVGTGIDNTKIPRKSTLGLAWNMIDDVFQYKSYKVDLDSPTWTKRSCLSQGHKIYDPLGYAAPILVEMRMVLQECWKNSYDWDVPIEDPILGRWKNWLEGIKDLERLRLPRVLTPGLPENFKSVQLHVFADASKDAYAAAAYIRLETDTLVHCNFAMCRYNVAPVKQKRTIPKLELIGIELAARLAKHVAEPLDIPIDQITIWSDSKTALQWLRMEPITLQILAHNYVTKILKLIPLDQVRWVPGKQNPADLATRYNTVSDISGENTLWQKGPEFLLESQDSWPQLPELRVDDEVIREIKKEFKLFDTPIAQLTQAEINGLADGEPDETLEMYNGQPVRNAILAKYYKSYTAYLRVISHVIRFVRILKWRTEQKKSGRKLPPIRKRRFFISRQELDDAEIRVVFFHQSIYFRKTRYELETKGKLLVQNKFSKLGLVFEPESSHSPIGTWRFCLIRLCGRLKNATHLSEKMQKPFLLHPHDQWTQLLIRHHHEDVLCHTGGIRCLMSEIHKSYWIAGSIRQIQRTIKSCVTCRRHNAKPGLNVQQMAPLPTCRIPGGVRVNAFTSVAIDVAGPWDVKYGRATIKRWMLIIRCLMYGAVHLEVVWNMTGDSFLLAFDRFTAERTVPHVIYCDNGTNFVAGSKQVDVEVIDIDEIRQKRPDLTFEFSPPRTPHYQGPVERMIGSAKNILKRLLPDSITDEFLISAFKRTQKYLNNRPIGYKSSDSNDLEPITPAHFLMSGGIYDDITWKKPEQGTTLALRFKFLCDLMDQFWDRFSSEASPYLRKYNKWLTQRSNLVVGDIVALLDEKPSGRYLLGRVDEVFPGDDGLVRKVKVWCPKKGTFLFCSIGRLYVLVNADSPLRSITDDDFDAHGHALQSSSLSGQSLNSLSLQQA